MSTDLVARRVARPPGRPRASVVMGFALLSALLMAWSLRGRAQFLPTGSLALPQPVAGAHGHGGGVDTAPAPVTGVPLANYPGLVFLGVHVMLPGAALVSYGVIRLFRRIGRDCDSVTARLIFAAAFTAAAVLATPAVAALSLGPAITFANTLAAAVMVAQYTFALAVVGVTVFGVP